MDSLNFEIVLNYTMKTFTIKPPNSYSALIEIIKEKFDLTSVKKLVYENEDEDIAIRQDTDYLKLLDYAEKNELKEIDVIIRSDETKKSKPKKSLRKRSSICKPYFNAQTTSYDDNCINDQFDAEFQADLRNTKFAMEEGRWSNQSYNKSELQRIYYIKEKKAMQREEQLKGENKLGKFEEQIDVPVKKNNKRTLKSEQGISEQNSPLENNSEKDNGKNFYKSKKKK